MTVLVTTKHIRKGIRNNCYSCPVALAIIEATECDTIYVDETSVGYGYREEDGNIRWIHHNLPRSAQRFIKRYDYEKPVKPFKFILSERTKCR